LDDSPIITSENNESNTLIRSECEIEPHKTLDLPTKLLQQSNEKLHEASLGTNRDTQRFIDSHRRGTNSSKRGLYKTPKFYDDKEGTCSARRRRK